MSQCFSKGGILKSPFFNMWKESKDFGVGCAKFRFFRNPRNLQFLVRNCTHRHDGHVTFHRTTRGFTTQTGQLCVKACVSVLVGVVSDEQLSELTE